MNKYLSYRYLQKKIRDKFDFHKWQHSLYLKVLKYQAVLFRV